MAGDGKVWSVRNAYQHQLVSNLKHTSGTSGSCSQYTDIAGSYDGELSRIYPTQYREIYFVIALMEETLKTNLSHIK